MITVLRCEKCDRPAETEKKSISWKEGRQQVIRTVAKQCPCGGMIKPMIV